MALRPEGRLWRDLIAGRRGHTDEQFQRRVVKCPHTRSPALVGGGYDVRAVRAYVERESEGVDGSAMRKVNVAPEGVENRSRRLSARSRQSRCYHIDSGLLMRMRTNRNRAPEPYSALRPLKQVRV